MDPLRHKPADVSDADYLEILDSSVHNRDADRYMLGKYNEDGRSYVQEAGDDHVYFSLGEKWDEIQARQGLDDDGMFEAYNLPFLEDAVASGKPIDFSHDPERFPGSALWKEYKFLLDPPNSYKLDTTGGRLTMLPPGGSIR